MKQATARGDYEADYALSLQPGEADDLETLNDRWYWTGWKRRHWPANVVRRGLEVYGFDTRPEQRRLVVLLRITRGGSFTYTSKTSFSREVKQVTGWMPFRDEPHWGRVPVGRMDRPCTGIALRWEVVKAVDIRLGGRFPQLAWLRLADKAAIPSLELDAADLYREGDRVLREHLAIERNAQLRAAAKAYWREKMGGRLRCKVCDFDFAEMYGVEWIEMHHIEPMGSTRRKHKTVKDPEFDDAAVADHFDAAADAGITPARCGRIWCHTHPGESPHPSTVDEETFGRVFGSCDWSVMFILSRACRAYARLGFSAGPGGAVELAVAVDWESWPREAAGAARDLAALAQGWAEEFLRNVIPAYQPLHTADEAADPPDAAGNDAAGGAAAGRAADADGHSDWLGEWFDLDGLYEGYAAQQHTSEELVRMYEEEREVRQWTGSRLE
jgi:hypothetical protein